MATSVSFEFLFLFESVLKFHSKTKKRKNTRIPADLISGKCIYEFIVYAICKDEHNKNKKKTKKQTTYTRKNRNSEQVDSGILYPSVFDDFLVCGRGKGGVSCACFALRSTTHSSAPQPQSFTPLGTILRRLSPTPPPFFTLPTATIHNCVMRRLTGNCSAPYFLYVYYISASFYIRLLCCVIIFSQVNVF